MPDIDVPCVQCREVFLFTEKDQELFYQRNMPSPQRCAKCRTKKSGAAANSSARFEIICDHCGKHDRVPFQPKAGRTVLCKECHQAHKSKVRFD
ncbi:MAG: CxxC-x17-CxxC domain-containing protein [Pyrinomonadaceae bacterium]